MNFISVLYTTWLTFLNMATWAGSSQAYAPPTDSSGRRYQQLNGSINRLHADDVLLLFPQLMKVCPATALRIPCIPPVGAWDHNRLSSAFGWRLHPLKSRYHRHEGIDIAGPPQYVRSAASGRVMRAGYAGGLGLYVVVDHGNSYQTTYGHLARILCRAGQQLAIGQAIGVLGKTGQTTGLHLHYAIKKSGRFVNPAPYLTLGLKLVIQYQAIQTSIGADE